MGTRSSPGAGSRRPFSAFKHINIYANTDLLPFDFYRRCPEAWHIQDVPAFFFFFSHEPNLQLPLSSHSQKLRSILSHSGVNNCFRFPNLFHSHSKTNIKFTHCSHHLHPSCFLYLHGFREWLRPSPCQSTKCLHIRHCPSDGTLASKFCRISDSNSAWAKLLGLPPWQVILFSFSYP